MVLDLLQLGVGDDAFELMEALLHQREAESRRLLLPPDPLQLSPPHLLGNAGTLLPLLDPLRQDLVDTTGTETQRQTQTERDRERYHLFQMRNVASFALTS